jgi:U3 small nucleolar ribonucleoprotein protein IMP4
MPDIVLTSSRDPSVRMRQFLNDLEDSLPNATKLNRGRMPMGDLVSRAIELGARSVVYVTSRGGNPGRMLFMRIMGGHAHWLPYTVGILGVKLTVDMGLRFSFDKPRTGIIASTHRTELLDVLGEVLHLPHLVTNDVEALRGTHDVVILVTREWRGQVIQWLDGRTLGPRGPLIRCSGPMYRVIPGGRIKG